MKPTGHRRGSVPEWLTPVIRDHILMTMSSRERRMAAGEFKAKCLALLDDVETHRRSFVVTKRGRPVARVVPLWTKTLGPLVGSLVYEEDPLAPVDVQWEALE